MIKSIKIENFKSVQSLELELGRLNIFIGANGSGKSNILEAVAMGSAAMEDKLDDEFLAHRGIRVTEFKFMESGFNFQDLGFGKIKKKSPISVYLSNNKTTIGVAINSVNENYNKWETNYLEVDNEKYRKSLKAKLKDVKTPPPVSVQKSNSDKSKKYFSSALKNIDFDDPLELMKFITLSRGQFQKELIESINIDEFFNFAIYAPENHFLRRFEEEGSLKPLGIKGEGLFKLITIISQEYPDQFNKIKKHLKLIDWFEDFEIPNDLKFTERRIKIKDQFLDDDLNYFDQRSANEGFLYLLFYLTLFISNETPHFFAIDNIDNSLNPKLGSELIKVLAQLSKDHNKQALLTTHNPVILDGLDLNDDDQRLFVVYRNADGHTKARRIMPRKPMNGIEPVRLSEAFIRGYIGGLPDNF